MRTSLRMTAGTPGVAVLWDVANLQFALFPLGNHCPLGADGDVGPGAIEDPRSSINAMGRLQPGGTAHMAMVDGSVLLKRPVESVTERLWGERFYAITGRDDVLPPQ